MTRVYSGAATVTNGLKTVTMTSGDPLSAANCPEDAPITISGVQYHVASRTDTIHLELSRNYEGTTGTGRIVEIDPLTPATLSVLNLAVLTANVQAQMNVLDKNSQGLFYNRVGVTGDTDTAPGNLAFDSGDPTAATALYIDNLDGNQRSVTGLLDLWTAGTIILVRSLATTAYVAYRLPSGVDAKVGYYSAALQYVDHDGVLADGEAVSIGWFRVGEGLEINAVGTFAERATYNTAPAGFFYLSSNGNSTSILVSSLFRKNTATSGDWSAAIPFQGPVGDRGWAPRFAVVADGSRRVMQLAGYVGGTGTTPTNNVGQYVTTGGYTATIGSATDIRGGVGLSAYDVAVLAGFVGDDDAWLASLVGHSAYQVAVLNGFVGDEDAWLLSLRGDDGIDGTDPGVYFVWSETITDSDPGSGVIRASDPDITAATQLFVSKTNRASDDVSVFLASLNLSDSTRKGTLTITRTGGNAQVTYDVMGVTDATGYVKIDVANGSGADGFITNDAVSFLFSAAGDRGTNGDGAGDVVGPAVAVQDSLATFDGTSGKLIKDSGVLVSLVMKTTNNLSDLGNKNIANDNLHLKGADVASAATVDLESATGEFINVTGTTTTTAITLASGHQRMVRATGAWPLTHGTNLQLPGATNYTCVAGDLILFQADGAVVRTIVFPVSGLPPKIVPTTRGGTGAITVIGAADTLLSISTDIASAATTDLNTATGTYVTITGTTTITSLGSGVNAGRLRIVNFGGALTLTHSGNLILPGSESIVTGSGDTAIFVSNGTTSWRCISYTRRDGNVKFSATQSASSDPHVLDDYEEGTFTPIIIGSTSAGAGTYTAQVGTYTKIGDRIIGDIDINWTAHTGTGSLFVSGLPFVVGTAGACAIGQSRLTYTSPLYGIITITEIRVRSAASNVGTANTPMDTDAGLTISFTYKV